MNLTLYRMDVKNLLVAQRVGEDQYIGRNAGKTRHQGLEIDLQYRNKLSQSITFSPYLSYTLNDHSFVDFVDGDNDNLGLNAGINNVFNTNYAQSVLINAVGFGGAQPRYYYPGNRLNYFGGLQLNYVF